MIPHHLWYLFQKPITYLTSMDEDAIRCWLATIEESKQAQSYISKKSIKSRECLYKFLGRPLKQSQSQDHSQGEGVPDNSVSTCPHWWPNRNPGGQISDQQCLRAKRNLYVRAKKNQVVTTCQIMGLYQSQRKNQTWLLEEESIQNQLGI